MFFLVCMILLFTHADQFLPQPIIELSIILGWVAPFINLVCLGIILILIPKLKKNDIPLWLIYINIICFILQIIYFFVLHDT
jgi:hypothetical protein